MSHFQVLFGSKFKDYRASLKQEILLDEIKTHGDFLKESFGEFPLNGMELRADIDFSKSLAFKPAHGDKNLQPGLRSNVLVSIRERWEPASQIVLPMLMPFAEHWIALPLGVLATFDVVKRLLTENAFSGLKHAAWVWPLDPNTIYTNPYRLALAPPEVRQFMLAHEHQHLLGYQDLIRADFFILLNEQIDDDLFKTEFWKSEDYINFTDKRDYLLSPDEMESDLRMLLCAHYRKFKTVPTTERDFFQMWASAGLTLPDEYKNEPAEFTNPDPDIVGGMQPFITDGRLGIPKACIEAFKTPLLALYGDVLEKLGDVHGPRRFPSLDQLNDQKEILRIALGGADPNQIQGFVEGVMRKGRSKERMRNYFAFRKLIQKKLEMGGLSENERNYIRILGRVCRLFRNEEDVRGRIPVWNPTRLRL